MKQLTQEELEKKIDEILKKVDADTMLPNPRLPPFKKPPTPEKLVKRIGKLKGNGKYCYFRFDFPLDLNDKTTWRGKNIFIGGWSSEDWIGLSDKIATTLMELSLDYNIGTMADGPLGKRNKMLRIFVVKSEDGTTNITADVIQAFMNIAKRIEK